jgi:hypothetical protein
MKGSSIFHAINGYVLIIMELKIELNAFAVRGVKFSDDPSSAKRLFLETRPKFQGGLRGDLESGAPVRL